MRLFTAIDLPDELLFRLERVISMLRREALLKWSPVDNIHLTTKFIGEWPEAKLGELMSALEGLNGRTAFELEVKGFGWFPKMGDPRVLWSGVERSDALTALVRETEERLSGLGIAKETHDYTPHVTLARVKEVTPLVRIRNKMRAVEPCAVGRFQVDRFYLYESRPGSNASVYRKLGEFRFNAFYATTAS